MNELTSPHGSIDVAIAALLLVLGYRLVRPSCAREWVGIGAYAAGLAGQLLGAHGLLGGTVYALPAGVWILGAAALLEGLVIAGAPIRARRRAMRTGSVANAGRVGPQAGLALVLAGQLLRGPSTAGIVAVSIGIAVNVGIALSGAPHPRRHR